MKGIGGHQSATAATDEWLTPPDLIEQCGGPDSFDLDPCAPVDRLWNTARDHLTIRENGLARSWSGRTWFNPPYSEPHLSRFLAMMQRHNNGLGLLFARTETEWFHRYVLPSAAALLLFKGRLHFHYGVDWFDKDGKLVARRGERAKANAGGPHVLIAYGMDEAERVAELTHLGRFVPLLIPRAVAALAIPQTWPELLRAILRDRGPMRLDELYSAVARHSKAAGRRHWREQIRKVLQCGPFERTAPGEWRLTPC